MVSTILILLLAGTPPEARAVQKPTIFEQLVGTWGWRGVRGSDCNDNPHTISFSDDYRTMILTSRHPVERPAGSQPGTNPLETRYEVREQKPHSLRVFIVDPPETRLGPDRQPVVWELVLADKNRYRWRATHWQPGQYTRDLVRCKVK